MSTRRIWPIDQSPNTDGSFEARQIIEGLKIEIATPDEARDILSLKGGDRVGFGSGSRSALGDH